MRAHLWTGPPPVDGRAVPWHRTGRVTGVPISSAVLRAAGVVVRDAAVDVRRNALVLTAAADDLPAAERVLAERYPGAVVLD